MALYQLVFKGECTDGTAPGDAREAARSLFKASVDQLEKMFSGRSVVIRNKLEQAQAEKYRAVLAKHGMVSYVELMPGETPETSAPAETARPTSQPKSPNPFLQPESSAESTEASTGEPKADAAPNRGATVKVEPGDRPNVAGERVDELLASSQLTLDPVGVRMQEEKQGEAPMFENLDDWSLAPPGSDLGEKRESVPVSVPDISHLHLADDQS